MSKFTSKIIIRKSRINNGNVSRRISSNEQQILLVLLMEHIHKLWESLECFLVVSEDTTTIKGINITPLDILHTESELETFNKYIGNIVLCHSLMNSLDAIQCSVVVFTELEAKTPLWRKEWLANKVRVSIN